MSQMLKSFDAARRVSVPFVAIRTADQNGTVEALANASKTGDRELPVVQWDAARGISHVNDKGREVLAAAFPAPQQKGASKNATPYETGDTVGFVEAMLAIRMLPRGTVVLAHNAHRQLLGSEPSTSAQAVQAVANLRDEFKKNFKMLVMLGPSTALPLELEPDTVVLHHELPTPEELRVLVEEIHNSTNPPIAIPKGKEMERAIEALSGLSLFAAEQVAAMSLTPTGLDFDALWERKRVAIEQTRGLKVWRGKERFSDVVGCDAVKEKLEDAKNGRTPIGVCVFLDEIDKVFANVESDTSGNRMDAFRTMLTEMEDNEWTGPVFVGVPGGGKSLIAKAFGNECGVLTIAIDFGGMESKYVGESEGFLRHAIDVVKSIGRGRAYVIATSNNATVMRPEMQRRFTEGMFFFDVMTDAEREAAWAFYEKKYELPKQQRPDDKGWTGAEIRNCCRAAWNTNKPLVHAAKFIIPMSRSRASEIDDLRKKAHNTFLDANRDGAYVYTAAPMRAQIRAIALPAEALDDVINMKES